ncbi:MAG: hypothetical protein VYC11_02635, partial [Candidatus Thermoplasmatota archaeon]|nr:hypothetical protein [Candidatus Thermoplasmatota archaeon]
MSNNWGQQGAVNGRNGFAGCFVNLQKFVVNLWLLEVLVMSVIGVFPYKVGVVLTINCNRWP